MSLMDSISGFTGQPHSLDPNPQPEAVNMADDAVEGRHKCPQCGKSYTKNWRLVEHIRSHTGERPYKCGFEGCGKSFIRPFHLRRHLLVHTGTASFKCSHPGCNQTFMLKYNLNRHERRSHNLPFKCDFKGCSESFKKKSQLRKHVCSHTNEKPFRCEVEGCESGFISLPRLERHMKRHTKGYVCSKPGCAEAFDTFSKLNAHIRSHGFVCEHCKKMFGQVYQLRKHLLIHATDRPQYDCPKEGCNRSYTKACNLKTHIKTVHDGQKSYVCTVEECGKAFAYKKSLTQHQDLHAQGKWRPETRKKKKIKKKRKPLAKLISGYHSSHSESSDTFSLASAPKKRKESSYCQNYEPASIKARTLQRSATACSEIRENDISMKSTADCVTTVRTASGVHQNAAAAAAVRCELQVRCGPSDATSLCSSSVGCYRAQSITAQRTCDIGRRVFSEPQADVRGENISATTGSNVEHIEPTLQHSTCRSSFNIPKNNEDGVGPNASNTSQLNADNDGNLSSNEDTETIDCKSASPEHSHTESMLEAKDDHSGQERAREGLTNRCNSRTDEEAASIASRTESRLKDATFTFSIKRQTPPKGGRSPIKESNRSITVPDPRGNVRINTNKSLEAVSPLQPQAPSESVKASCSREICSVFEVNDFPRVDDPLQVMIEGKDLEENEHETVIQGNERAVSGSTCSTGGRPANDREENRVGGLEIRSQSDENERAADNEYEVALQEEDDNLAGMSQEISPRHLSGRRQVHAVNSYQEEISASEPVEVESCYQEITCGLIGRASDRSVDSPCAVEARCSDNAKIANESDVDDSDEEDISVSGSDGGLSHGISAKEIMSRDNDHSVTTVASAINADPQCVGNANYVRHCDASFGNYSDILIRDETKHKAAGSCGISPRGKALLQSPIDSFSGCVLSSHRRKSRNSSRCTVQLTSGTERNKDYKRFTNNGDIKRRGVKKSFDIQSAENHCTFSQSARNVDSSEAKGPDVSNAKFRGKASNFLPCDMQALELLWNFTGE